MSDWLCCTSKKHPNDFYCTWIQLLAACPEQFPRTARVRPTIMATVDMEGEGAETMVRGESERYEPGLDWLQGFIEALNLAETDPSTAQLLALAQALQDAGIFDDAVQVGKYLEYRLLEAPSASLIKAYEVQIGAYQALGDLAAAEAARQLLDHVQAVRDMRHRTGEPGDTPG